MKIVSIKHFGGGSSSAFSLNDGLIVKFPKLDTEEQRYSIFVKSIQKEQKLNAALDGIVKPYEIRL